MQNGVDASDVQRAHCKRGWMRVTFRRAYSQSRCLRQLSVASRLPLLIRRRSLREHNQIKIRASTIFIRLYSLAELVIYMVLQAHRGVCTEYPENTMSAFNGAVCQGYQIIELDPGVTADGVFVILHDPFINRTARRQDGSVIEERRKLTEMTYEEVAQYDYGVWFAPKFKGEKLPLLKDVLQWAKEKNVLLKIDNKIWNFPEKDMENFWALLRDSGAKLGMTCNSTDRVRIAVKELPNAEIHYDGEVTREILQILGGITDRLVVWLPYESKSTSWVKVPFATKQLCSMVKEYAKLGIWIVDNYGDFDEIKRCFAPDIVETPGQIKPMQNPDHIVDMHTHSEHSHDSSCPIADMWKV